MKSNVDRQIHTLLETYHSIDVSDRRVRLEAARRMGELRPFSEATISRLLAALKTETDRTNWIATEALGELSEKSVPVVLALLCALDSEKQPYSSTAAMALRTIREPSDEAIDEMLAALREGGIVVSRVLMPLLGSKIPYLENRASSPTR